MSGFRVCKRDQGFIGPGEHRKLRVEFPSLLVPEHPRFALMKPRPCGPDQDTLLLAGQAALGVMGPPPSSCRAGKHTPIRKDCVRWGRTLGLSNQTLSFEAEATEKGDFAPFCV